MVEATTTSPFSWLPAELLVKIIGHVYDARSAQFQKWHAESPFRRSDPPASKNIMAPMQISEASRLTAVGSLEVWRSLASFVLETAVGKNVSRPMAFITGEVIQDTHDRVLRLLARCASKTNNTLAHINVEPFYRSSDCRKKKIDLINIITPSAKSLKELQLAMLPKTLFDACNCRDCQIQEMIMVATFDFHDNVNDALVDLLCKATSLNRLVVAVDDEQALKRLLGKGTSLQVKPKSLELIDNAEDPVPLNLAAAISEFGSKAKYLKLIGDRQIYKGYKGSDLILSAVVIAALTVEKLHLLGWQRDLGFHNLFHGDMSHLRELYVNMWDKEVIEKLPIVSPLFRHHFLSLEKIERTAWLLYWVEAPHLRSLVVTRLDLADDVVILIELLREWKEVEDLALHSGVDDREGGTTNTFRKLLQALTPSSDGVLYCPGLLRLSITAAFLWGHDWHSSMAFIDPQHMQRSLDKIIDMTEAPKIGQELVELDKERWEYSSKNSASRPLKMIRIVGCWIEPSIWNSWIETSQCSIKWCYPEPQEQKKRRREKKKEKQQEKENLAQAWSQMSLSRA